MANNKKGFPTWLGVTLLIIVGVLIYLTFISNPKTGGTEVKVEDVTGDFAEKGGYVDGVWDATTKQCLPQPGRQGMVMSICCFKRDANGIESQTACKEASLQQSFWIGSTQYPDNIGIKYGISFRNTGTDKIDSAWVSAITISGKDATGAPVTTPSNLSSKFNSLLGLSHVGPVLAGGSNVQYGTTDTIYYSDFATFDERTYAVNMVASYTAANGADTGTSQGGLTLIVRKSGYGLGVNITQTG